MFNLFSSILHISTYSDAIKKNSETKMQEGQRVFSLKCDEIGRSYVSRQTVVSSVHIDAI